MITYLFDPKRLLAQGQSALRNDTSVAIWTRLEATVSVLFTLIHDGISDRGQIFETACKVPQVRKDLARRMLQQLCGNDPNLYLWRHNEATGFTLWS